MWDVHKFGGTSVGTPEAMLKCVEIVKGVCDKGNRIAVVVSAIGGKPKVTDLLLNLVHAAATGNMDFVVKTMEEIKTKHWQCISTLLSVDNNKSKLLMELIEGDLRDIMDLLKAVQLMKTPHEQILEVCE